MLAELKQWLEDRNGKVLPKSVLGQALEVLHHESGGRAERIQQIFSLHYDPNWERPQPR